MAESCATDSLSAVNQAGNESTRDPMASTAYRVQTSQNTPEFTDKSLNLETVSQLQSNLLDAGTYTQDTDNPQTTCMSTHPTVSDKSDRPTPDTDLLNVVGPKRPGDALTGNEIVISSLSSGAQLVLKTDHVRPKLETLSIAQWCAANCKILHLMLTKTSSIVIQYLEYMKRVCELADHYEWQSVLKYDEAFRALQKQSKCRRDADHPDLDRLYLRLRLSDKGMAGGKSVSHFSNSSKAGKRPDPCRLFNVGRCNLNRCKFAHVCSVPKCNQPHPVINHHNVSSSKTYQGNGRLETRTPG